MVIVVLLYPFVDKYKMTAIIYLFLYLTDYSFRIDIRNKIAPFESYFPVGTNPVALDLLQKMLQ